MGLNINVQIGECEFKADLKRGESHTFVVGERILADKLFYVLCGLDKDYAGYIQSDDVDFSHTPTNTVLAVGDKYMFVGGTIKKNLHKALKTRHTDYKQKSEEIVKIYNLDPDKKIKHLTPDEMLQLSFARAHFRKVDLVVANCCYTYLKPEQLTMNIACSPYTLVIV